MSDLRKMNPATEIVLLIPLYGEPQIARKWSELSKRRKRTIIAALLNIIEAELEEEGEES